MRYTARTLRVKASTMRVNQAQPKFFLALRAPQFDWGKGVWSMWRFPGPVAVNRGGHTQGTSKMARRDRRPSFPDVGVRAHATRSGPASGRTRRRGLGAFFAGTIRDGGVQHVPEARTKYDQAANSVLLRGLEVLLIHHDSCTSSSMPSSNRGSRFRARPPPPEEPKKPHPGVPFARRYRRTQRRSVRPGISSSATNSLSEMRHELLGGAWRFSLSSGSPWTEEALLDGRVRRGLGGAGDLSLFHEDFERGERQEEGLLVIALEHQLRVPNHGDGPAAPVPPERAPRGGVDRRTAGRASGLHRKPRAGRSCPGPQRPEPKSSALMDERRDPPRGHRG